MNAELENIVKQLQESGDSEAANLGKILGEIFSDIKASEMTTAEAAELIQNLKDTLDIKNAKIKVMVASLLENAMNLAASAAI